MEDQRLVDHRLKIALSLTINAGYQIDEAAFALLKNLAQTKEIKEILETTIEKTAKIVRGL